MTLGSIQIKMPLEHNGEKVKAIRASTPKRELRDKEVKREHITENYLIPSQEI